MSLSRESGRYSLCRVGVAPCRHLFTRTPGRSIKGSYPGKGSLIDLDDCAIRVVPCSQDPVKPLQSDWPYIRRKLIQRGAQAGSDGLLPERCQGREERWLRPGQAPGGRSIQRQLQAECTMSVLPTRPPAHQSARSSTDVGASVESGRNENRHHVSEFSREDRFLTEPMHI
jgi:hypothetical protein